MKLSVQGQWPSLFKLKSYDLEKGEGAYFFFKCNLNYSCESAFTLQVTFKTMVATKYTTYNDKIVTFIFQRRLTIVR